MMRTQFDRDYIYIYGPEWADELLDCLWRDTLALTVMSTLHLSFDDVRRFYLRRPHFERVRAWLLEHVESDADPVEMLLHGIWREKAETLARAEAAALPQPASGEVDRIA